VSEIKIIKKCRVCGSENLAPILDLGKHYVSDFVDSPSEQGIKVPLELVLCEESQGGCGLLQMKYSAPPESMWNEQYWYKSGINNTIKNDLLNIVTNIKKLVKLEKDDIVVDIGANDGTMLDFYDSDNSLKLVGFEPSKNVAAEAASKGFEIINNFFNSDDFKKIIPEKKVKVITAISMFYDLEDPNAFLKDITSILDSNGLFVIQQNYLASMLEQNALDNICHEHREYYTYKSLKYLLDKHNLEVFDVVLNDINGGSIRTYIRFKGSTIQPFDGAKERIEEIEKKEQEMALDTIIPYQKFAMRVDTIRKNLVDFIKKEVSAGKKIAIAGASTRGNTTLQYFDIGPNLITSIADKNPDKFGKMTIGTLIPIDSPEKVMALKPDYLLVLIWYFFQDIKKNQKEFFERGGKFILPLPEFKVISKED